MVPSGLTVMLFAAFPIRLELLTVYLSYLFWHLSCQTTVEINKNVMNVYEINLNKCKSKVTYHTKVTGKFNRMKNRHLKKTIICVLNMVSGRGPQQAVVKQNARQNLF